MSLSVNENLITEFTQLLDSPPPSGRQKEQVVQDFLENHSVLIPTPNRLNHQLHFDVIVSKFPLSTELITDYVYLTKSSDTWRVTFVELEMPDKKIWLFSRIYGLHKVLASCQVYDIAPLAGTSSI
jgi:hypothetical protein